jgi:hypothetical protein
LGPSPRKNVIATNSFCARIIGDRATEDQTVARFKLLSPVVGIPPRGTYQRFLTGTTIADSTANAIGNDIVWPALCAAPVSGAMYPLDASAIALMPPGWSPVTLFGVGLDAGY